MKKIFTLVITLFLGASLALAQNTGGDKSSLNPQPLPPGKKATTASTTKTKSATKGHKGGKKATKKTTTPPPK
ncbi:MAG TPA: hypothetical protein VKV30_02255 [Candidatus Angelobacter sp.]|nr:hypothetical protein [Candidatus Angelobacter sp.]